MGGEISFATFKDYTIIVDKNIENCIKADHSKKELHVSKDINLKHTDDGKLCAEFANFRESENKTFCGVKLSHKPSKYDCSVVISDPAKFNSCLQQKGIYQLSGSNLIFNGTKNDDNLILNGVSNSEIFMQDGDDAVLYREKATVNNDIDLGDGNNLFGTLQRTDADKQLSKNRITSGKGEDYIYLRDAIGNTVHTGAGKDLVEIQGGVNSNYSRVFCDNNIYTGDNNDTVSINGSFGYSFSGNKFYLGKGSDTFSASINPEADTENPVEYRNRELQYTNAAEGNEIYAKSDEKTFLDFLEKNSFESQTFTANKLHESFNFNACAKDFHNCTTKPIPQSQITIPQEQEVSQKPKKLSREDYSKIYSIGSLGYMLFRDPKMLESAFKALDDYVKSMQ